MSSIRSAARGGVCSSHRRLQVSLRFLLIVITVLGVAFAWTAARVHRVAKMRRAVKLIEGLGGSVGYDYYRSARDYERAQVLARYAGRPAPVKRTQPRGPRWLRGILGDDYFRRIVEVDLNESSVTDQDLEQLTDIVNPMLLALSAAYDTTDAGLEHLCAMTNLEVLFLDGGEIGDAGLRHLAGLPRLRIVSLYGTLVTDAGVEQLRALPELRGVALSATDITDGSLVHFRDMRQLRLLWLSETQISDAGLIHLSGLSGLQELHLQHTAVTEAGVANLQRSLPMTRIVR